MRLEIDRLLRLDWGKAGIGADDHVRSIIAMKLVPVERQELCALIQQTHDVDLAMVVAAVMGADPQPEYFAALKAALDRNDMRIVKRAAMGLIDGRYPGYLEILFSSETAKGALGDDFAFLLGGRGAQFTPHMRLQFLDMFCKRFGPQTPRLDAMTAPWFRLLAELGETNEEVGRILVRIWSELRPSDSHNKYLLLLAMSAKPLATYEPILKKAAKSKTQDLRELGQRGLNQLRGVVCPPIDVYWSDIH
jgi:hypothetical protein